MNRFYLKKTISCLSFIFLFHFSLADSLPEFQGEEVVVSATRQTQSIDKVLSDVSVISHEQIEKSLGEDLPNLLSRQAGLQVFTSGGKGSVSSIFMRGMSSQYSVILIDGMRIVSATNGTTSLSQIPLTQIDHIEILKGSSSSLYGADAVGGVIQIFTKRGSGDMNVSASIGAGDRGTFNSNFAINGKNKKTKTSYSLNISREQTDGFSATNQDSYNYNQANDSYKNTSYSVNLNQDLNPGHSLGFNLYQNFSDSDYDQSLLVQGLEKNRMSGLSVVSKDKLNKYWDSTVRYSHTQDDERFFEGSSSIKNSFFTTNQDEIFWQNDIKTGLGNWLLGSVYSNQHIASTTQYEKNKRSDGAVFVGYHNEIGKHLFQASLRRDQDNQFGGATTEQLAYGYKVTNKITTRISYGTAFKVPTFNDLYYPNYGNPNLQPEKSRNIELGLKAFVFGGSFDLVAFHNRLSKLIVYQNNSSLNSDVSVDGVSFSANTIWHDINLSASATYQNPYDNNLNHVLTRRARTFAFFSSSYDWKNIQTGVEWQLSGKRYDYPYGLPAQKLAGYGLVNLYADYEFMPSWHISLRVNNIANLHYTSSYGYNNAGNNWLLNLRYAKR